MTLIDLTNPTRFLSVTARTLRFYLENGLKAFTGYRGGLLDAATMQKKVQREQALRKRVKATFEINQSRSDLIYTPDEPVQVIEQGHPGLLTGCRVITSAVAVFTAKTGCSTSR